MGHERMVEILVDTMDDQELDKQAAVVMWEVLKKSEGSVLIILADYSSAASYVKPIKKLAKHCVRFLDSGSMEVQMAAVGIIREMATESGRKEFFVQRNLSIRSPIQG